jgi:pre-mRNA-splicing factor ATP-dependent RNA helicase DHX15/PRP43
MSSKKASQQSEQSEEIFKKHKRFSTSMLSQVISHRHVDPETTGKNGSGVNTGRSTDNEGESTAQMSSKASSQKGTKNNLKRTHPETNGTSSSSGSRSSSSDSSSSSNSGSASESSSEEKKSHKKLQPDTKRRHLNTESPLITLPPQSHINPFTNRPYSPQYYKILEKRKELPAWEARDKIIQLV